VNTEQKPKKTKKLIKNIENSRKTTKKKVKGKGKEKEKEKEKLNQSVVMQEKVDMFENLYADADNNAEKKN